LLAILEEVVCYLYGAKLTVSGCVVGERQVFTVEHIEPVQKEERQFSGII